MGLLERLPQRLNERPPYFLGRDYLETLLASQRAADWIRIRCQEPRGCTRGAEPGGGGGWRPVGAGLTVRPSPSHSEMLLGPVPRDFVFLPKHKANAYK